MTFTFTGSKTLLSQWVVVLRQNRVLFTFVHFIKIYCYLLG